MVTHNKTVVNSALVISICLVCAGGAPLAWSGDQPASPKDGPSIEDYATIEAYVGEVPVYAFGYTYVYGVGPDLLPGVIMQDQNTNAVTKFKPKKSWEITSNLCGSTPAREPKTMWNDDQPLLPIHLIDGNPETAWCSRGMTAPDVQPEWIRIDMPAESTVASVALVCSKVGPSANAKLRLGKSLPKELTIKLSRDGKTWDTVHENKDFGGSDSERNLIRFDPRPAKMIWVVGKGFGNVGFWGPSFSIGQLEVHNQAGENLALVSRGSGVQVSSTHYGYGMDRFTQDMLWPIQYDLGFKWTRVGYDMGTYLWSYVEREKGKLQVDRRSDEAITEAHNNGLGVILCLDKGNWLYQAPPRKTDWKKSRVTEIMETYYDHQGWPHESEALLQGYLRYVDYMVRHFKGRVAYFEICNEWQGIGMQNYCKILNPALKTIKEADPNARVMLGSTGGFDRQAILRCLGGKIVPSVSSGRLQVSGLTVGVPKGIELKDATVSVDALSNAEAGIVLRYQDGRNYLLANYSPGMGGIYFHEVIDGDWGAAHGHVGTGTLGPEIRLEATVKGSNVTLALSDGNQEFTTTHTIQKYDRAGAVGLFHNLTPKQEFDNFEVSDASGKKVLEERFDRPDGPFEDWDLGDVAFSNPEKISHLIDAVGWHPFYQTEPDSPAYRTYRQDVAAFKKECEALGFKGKYMATEWTWSAPYPGAPDWCTEMKKAKYSARLMTAHSGMDVVSLYNETFQTGRTNWDCNLVRNSSFQVDPITPAQPQSVYYVLRNIATVLDGFQAAEFPVEFSGERTFDCYTFRHGDKELMLAAWIPGKTEDGIVESNCDITLPGLGAQRVWVVDVFNGTEQELNVTRDGDNTLLKGMLVKDYPVFVRLTRPFQGGQK